jgi:hypothetical protein
VHRGLGAAARGAGGRNDRALRCWDRAGSVGPEHGAADAGVFVVPDSSSRPGLSASVIASRNQALMACEIQPTGSQMLQPAPACCPGASPAPGTVGSAPGPGAPGSLGPGSVGAVGSSGASGKISDPDPDPASGPGPGAGSASGPGAGGGGGWKNDARATNSPCSSTHPSSATHRSTGTSPAASPVVADVGQVPRCTTSATPDARGTRSGWALSSPVGERPALGGCRRAGRRGRRLRVSRPSGPVGGGEELGGP